MPRQLLLRSMIFLTIFALFIGGVAAPTAVQADSVIIVRTIADELNTNSWCSLPEAITNANDDAQTYADCGTGSGNDFIGFHDDLGTATIALTTTLPTITDPDWLTISGGGDITISGNDAVRVLMVGNGAQLLLEHITITQGFCTSCIGSGMWSSGGIVNITNSTFSDNAQGIYSNGGSLTISDSIFSGNESTYGGAIESDGATTVLIVTNSLFTGNTSNAGGGAAISNQGTMTITHSIFADNTYTGGASGSVFNDGYATATITNTTFSNNAAYRGAGFYNNSGVATISNSTFFDNTSTDVGGAIANVGGTLTLINSTLANNFAPSGGGEIYQYGASSTLNLYDSILADNGSGGNCVSAAGTISGNNNLIEDSAYACGFTDGVAGNIIGSDPDLGTVTGSPAYFPLNSGSLALDAGDNATCISPDQRGIVRPQNSVCDIGAVEAEFIPPTVVSSIRASPSPTSAASVDFTVTFSENVTGVDSADFAATTAGVSGAAVSGVSGSGTTYTVTVSTGAGNGTIRLDVLDDDTIKDLADNPLDGAFTLGEVYAIAKTAVNYKSLAAYDGWVLESSENSKKGGSVNGTDTNLRVGDELGDKQYRSILHFDTKSIPDGAMVILAQLRVKYAGVAGSNPFNTHLALLVDIRKPSFGTAPLTIADFQAVSSLASAGTMGSTKVSGWYTASLVNGLTFVNKTGTTQFRLRFTRDDNDDNGADYLKLYSGNAGASSQPLLRVYYYLP